MNDLSVTQPIKSEEPVFSNRNMFQTVQGADPEAFGFQSHSKKWLAKTGLT